MNASPGTRDRVEIVKKTLGKSELGTYDNIPGRDLAFWVIGTKANIDKLDGPGGDAEFWAGVRSGSVSEADGLAGIQTRPAFGWVTATPHGNEPAAGEAISRELYELAARLDCENLNRLQSMDTFLMPVRNPDGRDNNVRTTAWAFDPNRDFGTHNQIENDIFIPEMNKYPGVFFIDAHQTTNDYFFPPNEDPVHHEISHFALDFIQNRIGPALQDAFNAQSIAYRNYSQYDLFTPEYGDTEVRAPIRPDRALTLAEIAQDFGHTEIRRNRALDGLADAWIRARTTFRAASWRRTRPAPASWARARSRARPA